MTAPRAVIPGRIYLITRRCAQRQFRLRPDDETNLAFEYCLAYAASMTGVRLIAYVANSNHHHTAVEDVEGRLPEFLSLFHTNLAKHQNAHHGLFENMWSTDKTSVVWCLDHDDLIDKVVYLLSNPVKDNLVEYAHQWPGAVSLDETLDGITRQIARPKTYFDPNGAMPDTVPLACSLPQHIDRGTFVARVRDGIEQVEEQAHTWRKKTGVAVLGADIILRQSPTDSPKSWEKRFQRCPNIASKAKRPRIEAIQQLKAFRIAYAEARRIWLAGRKATFPCGTWWLRRHAAVACHPW